MKKSVKLLSLSVLFTSIAWSAAPQQAEIILSSPTNRAPSEDAVSGVRKHHRAAVKHRAARHRKAAHNRAKEMQAPANDAIHEANDAVK